MMNYVDYFSMTQEPFSNAPVSRFYFNSSQHAEALTRLTYAVDSMKGLALLVGNIGAGKTTLARRMLDALPDDRYEAALLVIIHSGITASWLLRRIAMQLGVADPSSEKLTLLGQLYQ
ncbi:MAG TPA: AAA family ATPase, partial [Myxococcota bacterium]